jgi:hypothetical protein
MKYKWQMIVAAVSVLSLAIALPVAAQTSSPRCDNKLIRGDYAFTIEGQKLGPVGTPVGPQVGVAMTTSMDTEI